MLSDAKLRTLFRFDAIITIDSGLLMLAVPQLLIDWLQLGNVTPFWMRVIGVVWLLFGLWLLTLWNATYTRTTALIAAEILFINAVILVGAAVFGGLQLGLLGWVSILGTAALILFIGSQWWQLRARLA